MLITTYLICVSNIVSQFTSKNKDCYFIIQDNLSSPPIQ